MLTFVSLRTLLESHTGRGDPCLLVFVLDCPVDTPSYWFRSVGGRKERRHPAGSTSSVTLLEVGSLLRLPSN